MFGVIHWVLQEQQEFLEGKDARGGGTHMHQGQRAGGAGGDFVGVGLLPKLLSGSQTQPPLHSTPSAGLGHTSLLTFLMG